MIRINKLNKYYNKGRKNQIHVIDNTSIELPDKGIVALLGPSGCGKTTLLNAIGGLDKVYSGDIYINDNRITRRRTGKIDKIRNLNIGYIFQDYKLIDNMSVYDNVSMTLRMIGIKDKKEIKKRVDYILDSVGIYRYRYRPCSMLSGGERQRVGIARALVKNPDIILADEPTGNLDSKNTIEIMNIIKSISRDKLVLLVTHEVDLAKFYADRIIELVDGRIENDYENKDIDEIDYRIDNKLYLKDFEYHNQFLDNDINVDVYNDRKKLNLVVVVKNGSIYIKSNDNEKIEVIDSNSSIELVNDHYKKMDKSVYEKYSFDFDKIINNNIKLKYSSIYNIFTMFRDGVKRVFGYSLVKKILLVGFFLSSLFVTYSISNVIGILTIDDSDFVKVNKNYLKLDKKVMVDKYREYELDDDIEYVLPGNSLVNMNIKSDYYYQTVGADLMLSGSIASYSMISDSDLIYGRMPLSNREIVIDKMVYDKADDIEMIGLYELSRMIDVELSLSNGLIEYKIVGIVDMDSPSIYVDNSQFINIIDNSNNYDEESDEYLYDYSLYKDKLRIVSGSEPKGDYEVIVNNDLKEIFKLGKYIDDIKINGNKLKVVGYYTSDNDINSYFVSSNTNKYKLVDNSKEMMIYSLYKDKIIDKFNDNGLDLLDVYEDDRNEYISVQKDSMISSIILAIVMLVISLIEIILMMRASFLSRIKEVGIYRAIGVKKSDIYKMFISESFAISTIASLPGVLFMSYCIYVVSTISYVGKNYVMNIYVLILCVLVVYSFNVLVGLIPVFNTIRKTPAQILSKNEVD